MRERASELPEAHQHQALYASFRRRVVVVFDVDVLLVVGDGDVVVVVAVFVAVVVVVVVVDVIGSGSGDGHNFSQTNVLNLISWHDNGALFHPLCS